MNIYDFVCKTVAACVPGAWRDKWYLYRKKHSFRSGDYWENRYRNEENSGSGSYGRLADFKAEIINAFVQKNKISDVIEFGCGDGNQLSLLKVPAYIGFDVSGTVLEKVRKKFSGDKSKQFFLTEEYSGQTAELSMSLDVIYHLVEDEVFRTYVETLFESFRKYVMIYSSDYDGQDCLHVRHRCFSAYVKKHFPEWVLTERIPNRYPFSPDDPENTSFADFFIFEKKKAANTGTR